MAGLKLDPQRPPRPRSEVSWAAVFSGLLLAVAVLISVLTLVPGVADMDLELGVLVGILGLGSITFAILSLGDDG